jgi:hypothetical protein
VCGANKEGFSEMRHAQFVDEIHSLKYHALAWAKEE